MSLISSHSRGGRNPKQRHAPPCCDGWGRRGDVPPSPWSFDFVHPRRQRQRTSRKAPTMIVSPSSRTPHRPQLPHHCAAEVRIQSVPKGRHILLAVWRLPIRTTTLLRDVSRSSESSESWTLRDIPSLNYI